MEDEDEVAEALGMLKAHLPLPVLHPSALQRSQPSQVQRSDYLECMLWSLVSSPCKAFCLDPPPVSLYRLALCMLALFGLPEADRASLPLPSAHTHSGGKRIALSC